MNVLDLMTSLVPAPCSTASLARALDWTPAQVEMALMQLQRGGYVDRAIPNLGACSSGCGICSVKNFCPSHEVAQPPAARPAGGETWRLTDKGLDRVRQSH